MKSMIPWGRVAAAWLAVLMMAGSAAAQAGGKAGAADSPSFGFEVGLNFANLSIDTGSSISVNPSTKAGLLVGGFAMIPFTEMVGLQPEFLFVQRSFDVQTGTSASSPKLEDRFSAVEIPILARFDFALTGDRGFYAVVGPGFSFLFHATETQIRGSTSTETDVRNQLSGADVSVIIGAGLMFGKMGVEARYDAGLREASSPAPTTGSTKNRAFAVLFRYRAK